MLIDHHNTSENTITAPAIGTVTTRATSMASSTAMAAQTLSGSSLASINNLQETVKSHGCWIVVNTIDAKLHLASAIVSFIHPPG